MRLIMISCKWSTNNNNNNKIICKNYKKTFKKNRISCHRKGNGYRSRTVNSNNNNNNNLIDKEYEKYVRLH